MSTLTKDTIAAISRDVEAHNGAVKADLSADLATLRELLHSVSEKSHALIALNDPEVQRIKDTGVAIAHSLRHQVESMLGSLTPPVLPPPADPAP